MGGDLAGAPDPAAGAAGPGGLLAAGHPAGPQGTVYKILQAKKERILRDKTKTIQRMRGEWEGAAQCPLRSLRAWRIHWLMIPRP